jgi:cyanophycinase
MTHPRPLPRLLALIVGLLLCALLPLQPARAQGVTVAIGGALQADNAVVWRELVLLAGGPGARFVVLATASGEPERSAATLVQRLQAHGAVATALPVAPRWAGVDAAQAVRDATLLAEVERSRGVFLSGGAQARLLDTLAPGGEPTPLLQALRALWLRGGVVAGSSSGAAVLSAVAFRDAPDLLAILKDPAGRLRDGVEVDRGFGFLPADVVVDQHFIQRGRIARLLPLMLQRGLPLGLGVEEDSAAVVRGREVRAIGRHGVLVVDTAGARHTPGPFNVQGALLHWLAPGDRFDLDTRALTPALHRRRTLDPALPGFEPHHRGRPGAPPFVADMLAERALLTALLRLVDSDEAMLPGLSFAARPAADDPAPALGFLWELSKAPGTRLHTAADGSDASVHAVRLDVRPVRMAQPLYTPWSADAAPHAAGGAGTRPVVPR